MNIEKIVDLDDGGARIYVELTEEETNVIIQYGLLHMFREIIAETKTFHEGGIELANDSED